MASCEGLFSLPEDITGSPLFAVALTHRSVGKENNERLEFLGDAVLGLVIAKWLYERFPRHEEGDLSRLRAHLVCKPKLAELANEVNLSSYIQLGAGEKKSGGRYRSSILADSLEAVIGAIYLLKGYRYTAEFIEKLYANQFLDLPDAGQLKDPKTRLQEHLQSAQMNVPDYRVVKEWGEGNDKRFRVECGIVELDRKTQGEGKSKKKAEQAAANAMIDALEI